VRSRLASRHSVNLGKTDPDLIFVAGTGRSGTTWLAEMLTRSSRRRLIFEPFDHGRVPAWPAQHLRQYVRPSDLGELYAPAERILAGAFRNEWADRHNERFLTRGRIIKDIRANLLLRWLYGQLGPFPIVLLIRNPAAVVASWLREGWPAPLDELFLRQTDLVDDHLAPFVDHIEAAAGDAVAERACLWCIENYVPLRQFSKGQIHIVFYEDLVADPMRTLDEIGDFAGIRVADRIAAGVGRPSATTNPRSVARNGELSDVDRQRVLDIAAAFGLDRLYGESTARHADVDPMEAIA
jgi:Sulfotransferase family